MIISGNRIRQTLVALILLATLLAWVSIASAQQGDRLNNIEVVGLKRIPREQVIAASELKIGQTVNSSLLDAAATRLMQSGLFKKLTYRVRGKAGTVTVIFEVEEANRSLPVVFENFVWFTDDELANAIRNDIPFFNGTAPEAGDATEKIAASLQRLLNEKKIPGRVEVMPYNDLATGKQEILFTVKGVKIPVCSLHFTGAEAVSEAELIKTAQPLLNSDFSRKDISVFATYNLFPLYRRLGRLRAQFQEPSPAAENSPACPGGVAVTVPVNEGEVYSWAKADWNGTQALSPTELSAAIGMKTGEIADGTKIDAGLKDVRRAYGRKGYLTVRIKESAEFDESAHWVSYRFAIQEGPQYHMGNLIINGLAPDLTQNLKESWTLASGAVFDESYVEDFRLNALPRFIGTQMQRSPAFHATAQTTTRPDAQKLTVDVIITFKEN